MSGQNVFGLVSFHLVWFGLFAQPLSPTYNNGHVSYSLQFMYSFYSMNEYYIRKTEEYKS